MKNVHSIEYRVWSRLKSLSTRYSQPSTQKGFTLIEAVVSTAVFAFVVSSVVATYLSVASIDSRTRADRGVQQNARFIMDFLGKEIRNGSIKYAAYPSGTIQYTSGGYATDLRLANQSDEDETISCSGTNLSLTKSAGVTNLNSPKVNVTRCAFYINPATNPFLSTTGSNQQPYVTVVLQLTSNNGARVQDISTIDLQSTFAVRDYPSRP